LLIVASKMAIANEAYKRCSPEAMEASKNSWQRYNTAKFTTVPLAPTKPNLMYRQRVSKVSTKEGLVPADEGVCMRLCANAVG
jgi:hypothetical protein